MSKRKYHFGQAYFENIQSKVDWIELLKKLGYSAPKKYQHFGSDEGFHINCPFHHDKTPSLLINLTRGRFRCFGCNREGDKFSFICQKLGNTNSAVKFLRHHFGLTPPKR